MLGKRQSPWNWCAFQAEAKKMVQQVYKTVQWFLGPNIPAFLLMIRGKPISCVMLLSEIRESAEIRKAEM